MIANITSVELPYIYLVQNLCFGAFSQLFLGSYAALPPIGGCFYIGGVVETVDSGPQCSELSAAVLCQDAVVAQTTTSVTATVNYTTIFTQNITSIDTDTSTEYTTTYVATISTQVITEGTYTVTTTTTTKTKYRKPKPTHHHHHHHRFLGEKEESHRPPNVSIPKRASQSGWTACSVSLNNYYIVTNLNNTDQTAQQACLTLGPNYVVGNLTIPIAQNLASLFSDCFVTLGPNFYAWYDYVPLCASGSSTSLTIWDFDGPTLNMCLYPPFVLCYLGPNIVTTSTINTGPFTTLTISTTVSTSSSAITQTTTVTETITVDVTVTSVDPITLTATAFSTTTEANSTSTETQTCTVCRNRPDRTTVTEYCPTTVTCTHKTTCCPKPPPPPPPYNPYYPAYHPQYHRHRYEDDKSNGDNHHD